MERCELVRSPIPGTQNISLPKRRCIAHEGDEIFHVEFHAEKTFYIGYVVSRIDDKGIELGLNADIFMSSVRAPPFRIDYGESTAPVFGRFVLDALKVRAEKGPETGTAVVSIE